MNIAIILAGGSGTRILVQKPKQLIKIDEKPILIHTTSIFLANSRVSKVIIVCSAEIIKEVNELIKIHLKKDFEMVEVIKGGSTRSGSLLMAYNHLDSNHKLNKEDIIITHDVVRMFVSNKLIDNSIIMCKMNHVVVPIIDETDSVLKLDNDKITMIDRKSLKRIQTPQTLHYQTFKEIFRIDHNLLDNPDWDLCWLSRKSKIGIIVIEGSIQNLKITTDFDLLVANIIYWNIKNK